MRTETFAVTRRHFIGTAAVAAAGAALSGCASPGPRRRTLSANDKLNVGIIGVSGQGGYSIENLKSENIIALCDVDADRLAGVAKSFPSAKTYRDFRKLIDQPDLDAIVVATPDHTHAVATAAVLRSGRDVYCEKPLTHTVSEARAIAELARKCKAVTQIGTQIHAGNNYRRVVELVQSGAVGPVREVHVWQGATYGGLRQPNGEWKQMERPTEAKDVPPNLDWDMWLGPVEPRPYHPDYVPFRWRNWWAFGGGTLADFGCHFMDLPFWALSLKYPTVIEPLSGPPVHPESTPPWLVVRFSFPARAATTAGLAQPPVKLTWYHGGKYPTIITPEIYKSFPNGVLFMGEKGNIISDYSKHRLLPEERFADFKRPAEFIPNSIGHHKEWVQAIKTRGQTTCHFGYSGPLTETALLGNVAFRVGCRLEWDSAKLRAPNCPAAEELIQHHYRPGWKI
jgi:predicted dehydrogenase